MALAIINLYFDLLLFLIFKNCFSFVKNKINNTTDTVADITVNLI